jgi:hypothetical protein
MLRRVALVRTDVSEKLSDSVRVTRIGELGTTLAATSNRRALSSSETSVHTRATRRNISEDTILRASRCRTRMYSHPEDWDSESIEILNIETVIPSIIDELIPWSHFWSADVFEPWRLRHSSSQTWMNWNPEDWECNSVEMVELTSGRLRQSSSQTWKDNVTAQNVSHLTRQLSPRPDLFRSKFVSTFCIWTNLEHNENNFGVNIGNFWVMTPYSLICD